MGSTTFSGPVTSTAGFQGTSLTTGAGTGITTGTDTVTTSNITKVGNIITTQIYLDMDGLESSTTLADIIGVNDAANCHLGRITVADCGIVFGGSIFFYLGVRQFTGDFAYILIHGYTVTWM